MTAQDKNSTSSRNIRHGGRVLADQLRILGADTVFNVPGESFLAFLDGLYDHQDAIRVITCRQEGGAANMAEAYGKLTGKPGICAVTRGPGATNASNGVHTAFQDGTPMILLIGQVGMSMMDREAFQEIDYRRMFGQMAKWVAQIDDPARIPEYISRAWHTAMAGRPGPVVLALPEDMLSAEVDVPDIRPAHVPASAPLPGAMDRFADLLARAKHPLMILGGSAWSADCARKAAEFATKFDLPVATSFRRQDYIDNAHPNYGGVIGIAPVPDLRNRIRNEVDLLINVGPSLGEMTTQGYTLIDIPVPQMPIVNVHPGPETHGHVYAPEVSIVSSPQAFFDAALQMTPPAGPAWAGLGAAYRKSYEAFLTPTELPGAVNMGRVVRHMSETLPDDTVYTNGAGNYAVWLHRFHAHRHFGTQLAPTSGSMGYGLPAAIAAKLHRPDRTVVCAAGDGCFMMTAQEMATAARYNVPLIYLVVNNGMYGTIRMHQERGYPERTISTGLSNPDFVTYAKAFGIPGEKVTDDADFPAALNRARKSDLGYLIELVVDPEALTPTQTLTAAREQGKAQA